MVYGFKSEFEFDLHKSVNRPALCPACGSGSIDNACAELPAEWQCHDCGLPIARIAFVRPDPLTGAEPRYFAKPDRCPKCGTSRLATIIYGIPDFENHQLWHRLDRGELILAGNYTGEDYPLWQCLDCNAHLYSVTYP